MLERREQRLAVDVPHDGLAVDAQPTRRAHVLQNQHTNPAQ
jgi:hypothetical protein